MDFLVCHPDQEARQIIGFCLESHFGASASLCEKPSEALAQLSKAGTFQLVIVDSGHTGQTILDCLQSENAKIPLIVITPSTVPSGLKEKYAGFIADLPLMDVPAKLVALLQGSLAQQILHLKKSEFCQINADLLCRMSPLKGDVYIRLSDLKYVKLYKSGTVFSPADLEKIRQTQKVRTLFIKTSESADFIEKFKEELKHFVHEASPKELQLADRLAEVHEVVHELAHKIGFTPEVQVLAAKTVKLGLKQIGDSPELSKILAASSVNDKNSISYHSVVLASTACALASLMQWPSESTFHKLVLAALFHDFTFSDPALAKYSTLEELERDRALLGDAGYREVLNHPVKNVEIIKNLKEVPGDVAFLVFQHHERPDGSGFPNGLKTHQIMALSAVFIIAHELVESFLKLEGQFSLPDFLKQHEQIYDAGSFKKIWQILNESTKSHKAKA